MSDTTNNHDTKAVSAILAGTLLVAALHEPLNAVGCSLRQVEPFPHCLPGADHGSEPKQPYGPPLATAVRTFSASTSAKMTPILLARVGPAPSWAAVQSVTGSSS